MQSLGLFSAKKIGRSYIVEISGIRRDVDVFFALDTGSFTTLIGLNTICGNDDKRAEILKDIIERRADELGIKSESNFGKTITSESLPILPCRLSKVSVNGTKERKLYFHIYLGKISRPLLGTDFLDDCTFHHNLGSSIDIIGIAEDAGKSAYPIEVIDFDAVMDEYNAAIMSV